MDEMTDDRVVQLFSFQQSRRRADFRAGSLPTAGFGAEGEYTLWLPPPATAGRFVFKGGRPVRLASVQEPDAETAAIEALRDVVIVGICSVGPGKLTVPVQFLEYAARLVQLNYTMTDDDLDTVLAGSRWQDGVLRHLLGGDKVVDLLADKGGSVMAVLSAEVNAIAEMEAEAELERITARQRADDPLSRMIESARKAEPPAPAQGVAPPPPPADTVRPARPGWRAVLGGFVQGIGRRMAGTTNGG